MKTISKKAVIELEEALSHMHVSELKTTLERLQLSTKAFNKEELINRLAHYAATGKELKPMTIPLSSRAKKGVSYPLDKNTPMLHGSYKNDLKTRLFFKSIIGDHFHFTAQGIDWLRTQWLQSKTPTYNEFAQEWMAEYKRNQQEKRAPKREWAYIRFTQKHLKSYPDASKKELLDAWNNQRKIYLEFITNFFKQKSTQINEWIF